MRITGLASGLDMDEIVKNSMKPYRIKVDETKQKREIVEMKQQLYRDVIKDSREFYNKYFDVLKPDSLLRSANYGVTKFTSSDENVLSVKGGSEAKAESYTITGTTATAAKAVVTTKIEAGEKVVVNGNEFTLKGVNEKEIATNLSAELKSAGINVSVRYSDFAGTSSVNKKGLLFEATVLGKDSTFTIGGGFLESKTQVIGTDATASTVTGLKLDDLKSASGKFTINGKEISIEIKDTDTNGDIEKSIQSKISDKKLSVKINEGGDITFSSTVLGSGASNPNIEINNRVGVFETGEDGSKTTNTIELDLVKNKKININGKIIDLSNAKLDDKLGEEVEYLNKILASQGIEAKLEADKIVLSAKEVGADKKIDLSIFNDIGSTTVINGVDTSIKFTDSKGGVNTQVGDSNTITLDGITFKFSGKIPDKGITVNGKTDSKELADKIVSFVDDYNILMEKLNTITSEKRNKNYMPLTEDQKKEMSESEIKLWNEKTKEGQLNRDSDITRIANKMKSSMTSVVGSGLNLESIGIKPVSDYQSKNGTFKVDVDKLTTALENNPEEVMNLFIGTPSKDTPENEKESKTGVFQKLKTIIYDETITVASSLIKKVGVEGSSTVTNNDLTRSIEAYNKKMADLEKDFTRREQALYSKYAKLEVIMNNYNNQQSMMTQQLGGN